MEITNVAELENDYEVHATHNGVDFYYRLSDSLHSLFHEDIERIKKTFFRNEHIDFSDVMSNDDVLDVFSELRFINNQDADKRIMKLEEKYLKAQMEAQE